jgi:small GTP-binding protein
MFLGGKGQHF